MSLALAPQPRRRRLSLTPLIDVVFLLLVFFMLAARFGAEGAVSLGTTGAGAAYEGPPRLVSVTPGGLLLNGRPFPLNDLPGALGRLIQDEADVILLQAEGDVPLQRLVDVITALNAAGFENLVLVP